MNEECEHPIVVKCGHCGIYVCTECGAIPETIEEREQ